jgi:transposase-like protein
METKQRKAGETDSEALQEIPKACVNETAAVEFMEKQRWGDTPACPRCGSIKVQKMTDGNGNRNERFLWRCHDCKDQFTVRIGTVFEDSHIPLRIWCHAFWRACASKKGVSALQISRECSITYKSALFLMHRVRYAMAEPKPQEKFKGIVECDETYVGGKPRRGSCQVEYNRGLGTKKTPVVAIVERQGRIRVKPITTNVTGKTLRKALNDTVDKSSRLCTDESRPYRTIGREFAGGHGRVQHNIFEYARGKDHVNTCESFFALLKRGIYGTFHAVSKKHLHRYCDEFGFRWDTRGLNDGERISAAIKRSDGKRLMYRQPTTKSA